MPQYTQNDHPIRVSTPLGQDAFLVDHFTATESISRLFDMRLRLRSQKPTIEPASLIGQSVSVEIDRTDGSGSPRYFHGLVSRFESHGKIDREFGLYTAVLRPWTWLMTHNSDCKIFQQQSALDIVRSVLSGPGGGAMEVHVSDPPPTREYCVQYNESDFAFISRLLEEEGIFYYFRHEQSQHVMVLCDSASSLPDCDEQSISLQSQLEGGHGNDRLRSWVHEYELRPGNWAQNDYDFESPSTDLLAKARLSQPPIVADKEVFRYPGIHTKPDVGDRLARIRAQQLICGHDAVTGLSVAEAFSAGCKFSIDQHHDDSEQGRSYILTSVYHEAQQLGSSSAGAGSDAPQYSNRFVAIPGDAQIRPARETAKPFISGPQTAIVVGPPGEEIWTDKYGRIKIQFHWDRCGQRDDQSSCWVRVAFAAAGATWGMIAVPRIGNEVVVEFIDGDPDRPLITGCVYNNDKMPPVSGAGKQGSAPSDTPAARMVTTFRSQSLNKTGGFNEISMDDTSGQESLYLKAQYDENHEVGNNRKTSIKQKETLTIGDQRQTIITNDDQLQVGADHKVTVNQNDQLQVGADHKVSVAGNQTIDVQQSQSITAMQISITAQTKLTLQCGGSTLELTPGMLSISAPMVKIN